MPGLNKKVLLIKPNYHFYPIGFGLVVAALEKNGIEYDFLDTFTDPDADVTEMVRKGDYLAVASGGLIGNFTFFRRIFQATKAADDKVACILGGNVTADLQPNFLFDAMPVDYLVIGEGEETFPELLVALDRRHDLNDVLGLAYRAPNTEQGYVKTARRPKLDLQSYNWSPDWRFLDISQYNMGFFPILTGRGCTGHCSFCSPTNGWFRARPLPHILEEIENVLETFDPSAFHFLNEIMFPTDDLFAAFCAAYKQIPNRKPWFAVMRPDVDPSILPVMKDAGCRMMNIGVESGSDTILETLIKETTVEQVRTFTHEAKKAGVIVRGSFMMANYGETKADMEATVDLMSELRITGPMALTINYPGTLNYRKALKDGLIGDEVAYLESLDLLYSRNHVQVISDHMSGKINYLNLSAMPTEDAFNAVEKAMRRHVAEVLTLENGHIEPHGDTPHVVTLKGNCRICGTEVTKDVVQTHPSFGDMRVTCPGCSPNTQGVNAFPDFTMYLPIQALPAVHAHLERLKPQLDAAERILLVGHHNEVFDFVQHDPVGFDYDKIVGVMTTAELPAGDYVMTHKVLSFFEATQAKPDLIVVLGNLTPELQQFAFLAPHLIDRVVDILPGRDGGDQAPTPPPPTSGDVKQPEIAWT